MQKQQSIILIVGICISLILGSEINYQEGSLNLKLNLNNFYGIILTITIALIPSLKQKQKVRQPSSQSSPKKNESAEWEDLLPESIIRKDSYQESLPSDCYGLQSTQSHQDIGEKEQQEIHKRSSSEGKSRKVSFDESLNTVHTYKKNNKMEIKNFEVSFQQLKTEKKKKSEQIKQKRKEENFKKININDINKKARKRKSSLDDRLSSTSSI